jgi:hypothetical protein
VSVGPDLVLTDALREALRPLVAELVREEVERCLVSTSRPCLKPRSFTIAAMRGVMGLNPVIGATWPRRS